MKPTLIQNLSTSKGEFTKPISFSKSKFSSGYELHPSLKAMVQAQPLFGYDNEDPFDHLQDFEKMCSCLSILALHKKFLSGNCFPSPSWGR
jgi:hypothetical protein